MELRAARTQLRTTWEGFRTGWEEDVTELQRLGEPMLATP